MNENEKRLITYLNGYNLKINHSEDNKKFLNEWLLSIEKDSKEYKSLLKIFKNKYGWNDKHLDALIKNDLEDFFDNMIDIKKELKDQVKKLNNQIKEIFTETEAFTETDEYLSNLKDNQLMEAKTVIELFIASGDIKNLKDKITKIEFIEILNKKLGREAFEIGESGKNKGKVKYGIAKSREIDIRYKADNGKIYFVDTTSDSFGIIDFKEGMHHSQQPIIRHYEQYLEIAKEEGIEDNSDYYFLPNVGTSLDQKLKEEEKLKGTKIPKLLSSSKTVVAFLTILSKQNHLLTDSISEKEYNKYNEGIKTIIFNTDGQLKENLTIDFEEIFELLKNTYNKQNPNDKLEVNEETIYNIFKKFKFVGKLNLETETYENFIDKISNSIQFNYYAKKVTANYIYKLLETNQIKLEELRPVFEKVLSSSVIDSKKIGSLLFSKEETNKAKEETNKKLEEKDNAKYNKLLRAGNKTLEELIIDITDGYEDKEDLTGFIKYYIKRENITILTFDKVYEFFTDKVKSSIQDKDLLADIELINKLCSDEQDGFLERLITDSKLTNNMKDKNILKEIILNTLLEENIIKLEGLEEIMKNTTNKGNNLQKSLNNINDFISPEKKKELIIILKEYRKKDISTKDNSSTKM